MPAGMKSEFPHAWRSHSKLQRILLIAASTLLVLCAVGIILLAHYWPFSQGDIVALLEETVPGTKVTMAHFHSTYFVHPGCWAEEVIFARQTSPDRTAPLVTVQKLIVQANYYDLFLRPGYISRVVVDGLHVQVSPRGPSRSGENASTLQASSRRRTTVGEIDSSGALLEIGRRGADPLKFEIHDVKLTSVGAGKIMSYTVSLQNPVPPGEVQSTGRLGPWNNDLGQIPLSGTYKFDQANLGAFAGLAGTLSSTGKFEGMLGDIRVAGDTDIPDFVVRGERHPSRLKTRFELKVNGLNGDVRLTRVNALLQSTPIQVQGRIAGKDGSPGKITTLDLSADRGQVQDILRPFVEAPKPPPMSGPVSFRAHVTFPSEFHPFFKRIFLTGEFTIDHGHFSGKDTQESVDRLSAHSRGMKDANANTNTETVGAELTGHVVLSEGVAKFSNVTMSVPGALAQMNGTFNVINEKIDFHGTLKTDVKLSETTHGIKALLLKPLDPLFKRKPAGASIPVEMTGTYSQPHFGMEVVPLKH